MLDSYGLVCEIVPFDEKTWRTPGGALRSTGWCMKMSLKKCMEKDLLTTLQNYTKLLIDRYRDNALRYFLKADMRMIG
jgi:hypothetical protein